MNKSVVVAAVDPVETAKQVRLPAPLCLTLLQRATRLHMAGLKAFGVLIADPAISDHCFRPTDVVFFDPRKNRRNEPGYRAAFEAQGEYFRRFDDAGFVADPAEVLAVWRAVEQSGKQIVAPFHIHPRQPANFSLIDYRLHNPAFPWHLILSLRNPNQPVLRAFRVCKDTEECGITTQDAG
jgi:proteasome lid subunit RPN8/RPN11